MVNSKNAIWKIKFNNKTLMIALLLIFIAALLPVFRLAYYAIPFYDDYSYGQFVKSFYEAYGASGIIKGAVYTVKNSWHSWQGTYSSIFFMCINPMFLGEQYYFIGVWMVILGITVGAFLFSFVSVKYVLEADNYSAISAAVIITLLLEEFVVTSYQGIFWYNSAVHYTFMHGILFIMLAVELRLLYCEKKAAKVLLSILLLMLAIIVAGANFVSSLQGMLFLLLIFVIGIVCKKKTAFLIIPSVLCYGIGLYFNYGAPGNSHRAAYFDGMGPIEAILNSFKQAFLEIPFHTRIPSLIVLAVLAPIMWNVVYSMKYSFKLPGVVTLLCFCLYATGYTPSFYGGGGVPLERTECAIQYTYQVLLVVVMIYWLGWIRHKKEICKKLNYNIIYFAALSFGMILCLTFTKDDVGGYLSYGSYYYTHVNWAQMCRKEYLMRVDKIKNSSDSDVEVPPIIYRTWLLIGPSELSENPNAEQNRAMAMYYNKNSIYLEQSDNGND